LRAPGGDQKAERPAGIVEDHRDVLQVEGIDEPLQDLGVGLHALVAARGLR